MADRRASRIELQYDEVNADGTMPKRTELLHRHKWLFHAEPELSCEGLPNHGYVRTACKVVMTVTHKGLLCAQRSHY